MGRKHCLSQSKNQTWNYRRIIKYHKFINTYSKQVDYSNNGILTTKKD